MLKEGAQKMGRGEEENKRKGAEQEDASAESTFSLIPESSGILLPRSGMGSHGSGEVALTSHMQFLRE